VLFFVVQAKGAFCLQVCAQSVVLLFGYYQMFLSSVFASVVLCGLLLQLNIGMVSLIGPLQARGERGRAAGGEW